MSRLTPRQVVDLWQSVSTRIPATFALGSAYHETHYNASEVDAGDQSDGSDSIGLYQLSNKEAVSSGRPGVDLRDPYQNTLVFAGLMERNLDQIIQAAHLNQTSLPPDVWAYLALSHNQGIGAALKTIKENGLNWAAYAARNASHPNWISYYGDAITGGPDWNPILGAGSAVVMGLLLAAGIGFLVWRYV